MSQQRAPRRTRGQGAWPSALNAPPPDPLPAPTAWGAGTLSLSPTTSPAALGLLASSATVCDLPVAALRLPLSSPRPAGAGLVRRRRLHAWPHATHGSPPGLGYRPAPARRWLAQSARTGVARPCLGPVATVSLSPPSESVPFSATVAPVSHAPSCKPCGANGTRSLWAAALFRQLAACLVAQCCPCCKATNSEKTAVNELAATTPGPQVNSQTEAGSES